MKIFQKYKNFFVVSFVVFLLCSFCYILFSEENKITEPTQVEKTFSSDSENKIEFSISDKDIEESFPEILTLGPDDNISGSENFFNILVNKIDLSSDVSEIKILSKFGIDYIGFQIKTQCDKYIKYYPEVTNPESDGFLQDLVFECKYSLPSKFDSFKRVFLSKIDLFFEDEKSFEFYNHVIVNFKEIHQLIIDFNSKILEKEETVNKKGGEK